MGRWWFGIGPVPAEAFGMDAWIKEEIDGCDFGDRRLDRRFGRLLGSLSDRMGKGLPFACQDWAGTKAAYRFLGNPRVDEAVILEGHFKATQTRFAESHGPVLVLHDTTELSFQRVDTEPIGKIHKTQAGKRRDGRPRLHTICGLLMHSSLVVTAEGLPLGLAAIKFWTRKRFKGTNALKRKVNATRVPIERKESYRWVENVRQATDVLGDPQRCVHVGDREGDIFELFCAAEEVGTNFLVRTCVDRLADQGDTTVAEMMKQVDRGTHWVELADQNGKRFRAALAVRFCRMTILPPIGKQKRYPALSLTVIHAQEKRSPPGRERIDWRLLTNLPVTCLREAVHMLDWYAMRWKIETFHKILKSGCKAEEAKLRTAQRLTSLIAVYCIVSWRVFWLCMLNRTAPDAPAALVFTETEMELLRHVDAQLASAPNTCVSVHLLAVARLGGYLSRAHDAPPGNMVLWRGFARLMDIHLGFCIAANTCG